MRLSCPTCCVASALLSACADPIPGATDTGSTGSAESSATSGISADTTAGPTDASTGDPSSTSDDPTESTGTVDPCATVLGADDEPIFPGARGRFVFRDAPGYRSLAGFIADAPRLEFHHEAERLGACRLLTYEASACDPICEQPAVCVDGTCVSAPGGLSAGAVTLDGVGDGTLDVTEDPFHTYFWDHVGDDELSTLVLTASGADVPAFELSACPITAPTATGDWTQLLEARAPGEDVTLTWSDPIDTARVYLRMTTGIGTHGGISPVEIECEGPDVGALVLPGAYLDALYAQGWSCGECGGNDLRRYHADEITAGDLAVRFDVEATTSFWFIP